MLVKCYDWLEDDEDCKFCTHKEPHEPMLSWDGEGVCNEDWSCDISGHVDEIYCKPIRKQKKLSFKKPLKEILDI